MENVLVLKKWLINKKKVGKFAHLRKLPIMALILHSKQQKSYQGTPETLELIPIGFRTSHGPSMDPTVPLKWQRGPSWTFKDPQMDPKMDPPRLISGDPS